MIAGGQGTLHQHSNHHKASNQCCPNLGMPGSRVIRMAFHSQAASNDQRVSNVSTFWWGRVGWGFFALVFRRSMAASGKCVIISGWNLIAEKSERTGATKHDRWNSTLSNFLQTMGCSAVPLPCWNTGGCPGCLTKSHPLGLLVQSTSVTQWAQFLSEIVAFFPF